MCLSRIRLILVILADARLTCATKAKGNAIPLILSAPCSEQAVHRASYTGQREHIRHLLGKMAPTARSTSKGDAAAAKGKVKPPSLSTSTPAAAGPSKPRATKPSPLIKSTVNAPASGAGGGAGPSGKSMNIIPADLQKQYEKEAELMASSAHGVIGQHETEWAKLMKENTFRGEKVQRGLGDKVDTIEVSRVVEWVGGGVGDWLIEVDSE